MWPQDPSGVNGQRLVEEYSGKGQEDGRHEKILGIGHVGV